MCPNFLPCGMLFWGVQLELRMCNLLGRADPVVSFGLGAHMQAHASDF